MLGEPPPRVAASGELRPLDALERTQHFGCVGGRVVRGVADAVCEGFRRHRVPEPGVVAGRDGEEGVADEGVPCGLLGAASRTFLADDAVHLGAVHGVGALDGADGEQVGVAAGGGVGERCAGGGEGEEVVGEERSADLGGGATVDVVGRDDALGPASWDARLCGRLSLLPVSNCSGVLMTHQSASLVAVLKRMSTPR
jgi:hypothetical protein